MTPIISYTDDKYPVYFYTENSSSDDFPDASGEVHLSLTDNDGKCTQVPCSNCPIAFLCADGDSHLQILLSLIPTFADDYPHLCI